MNRDHTVGITDLGEIIEQRITSLVRELADAGWPTEDIVLAIKHLTKARWLDRIIASREASSSLPTNFVSDGSEG